MGEDPIPRPPRKGAPPYRADIDGLRALAVLAVLLFHSEVPGFAGGYAGVDVFFVVSGYLITQLLEQSPGASVRQTLTRFYLRRIRRILPALLATCVLTAFVAANLFLPQELRNLGRYLLATPLLLSNAASWGDGGYFAPRSPSLPLTHLWSIAVEEQFYLVYPVLLLLITRYLPHHRRATLIVFAGASLVLCIWASQAHPLANYFFAPTRAWELLLGATLALHPVRRFGHPLAIELLAVAGMLGLALAVHLYGPETPYPGSATLLPCAATAALILTGAVSDDRPRAALVNRVLAWRPLVFLGLVSYSLYLWHRPLLVFVRYYRIEPLGPLGIALVLAATLVVAVASWRFIEQPIRTRALLGAPAALLSVMAAVSLAVLIGGAILWSSNGLPERFPVESRLLIPDVLGSARWLPCIIGPDDRLRAHHLCSSNDAPEEAASRVVVWGDSHALAMMPAYEVLASRHHQRLYLAAKSDCPPLLSASPAARPYAVPMAASNCAIFNAAVAEEIARLDAQTVILDARWNDVNLPTGVPDIPSGIEKTIARLGSARSVCVVLGVPAFKYSLPYALVMARRRGLPENFLRLSRSQALAQFQDMEPAVRALAGQGTLLVADPKDALCPGESCLYLANGRSLYCDDNHLSPYGARYVISALERCFQAPAHRTVALHHELD